MPFALLVTTSFACLLIIQSTHGFLDGESACLCYSPSALIDECTCSGESLDVFNNDRVVPILDDLIKSSYFRLYQENLFLPCQWKLDDGNVQCDSCSVSTSNFLADQQFGHRSSIGMSLKSDQHSSFSSAHDGIYSQIRRPHHGSPSNVTDGDFYDLVGNPERFTGYAGASAALVWRLIYDQSCFAPPKDAPGHRTDKLSFFNIISGLHTSIGVDVSANWLLSKGNGSGNLWGPSVEEFRRRFDPDKTNGAGPRRLRNMYLVYLVQLRALSVTADNIMDELYCVGDSAEDRKLQRLARELFTVIQSYSGYIHESILFNLSASEIQTCWQQFENTSQIMNCVSCSKCKLWGKLRIAGLRTALRVLEPLASARQRPPPTCSDHQHTAPSLTHREISALVNSFGKLSKSIQQIGVFRAHME